MIEYRTRELKEERAEVIEQMEAIVRGAELAGRALTQTEDRRYKQLAARIAELDQLIDERERRVAAAAAALQAGFMPKGEVLQGPETFSITRLIKAQVDAREGRANPFKHCELEIETSKAIARATGREPRGFYVPISALLPAEQRGLVKGTPTAGGYLVATELLSGQMVELLRSRALTIKAGATVLGGLIGDVDIPRQTAAGQAYWVAENGTPTASQQSVDKISLSPKTVGAYTEISRKMLLQSSVDVEAFVRRDLANVIALAVDYAALHGTGQNSQPRGVANTSGVNIVSGGTNGAAPTWEHIVQLETEVAVDNADIGALAYMTNAKVAGKLKSTPKIGGYPAYVLEGDRLNGRPLYVTNQVRSDLTKGTGTGLSAIFFGNWSDLLIGTWGALDILVDPYSLGTSGGVRVVVFSDVDIAVRHPESFAAMLDAIA